MKLTIVRGLPGSGKTTTAKKIVADYNREREKVIHVEADMFFIRDYHYEYKSHLTGYAHQYCESTAAYFLNQGFNIVVANTFITKRSVFVYYELASIMGAEFEIVNCDGEFENIHEVPDEVLERMAEFKEVFTTEEFICYYNECMGQLEHGIIS